MTETGQQQAEALYIGPVIGPPRAHHSVSDLMIRLSNTESVLVEELLDSLSQSIDRTEGVSLQYANKTKLQKLLYFAIEEYDLPITYSWYLAGAIIPDTDLDPGTLETPQSPVSPDELSVPDVESPETEPPSIDPILFSGSADPSDRGVDSVYEIVTHGELIDFYSSILPDVWSQNTMRFLQNFYQNAAPPAYRSLYIESTHLRTHLDELIRVVEAHRSGAEPTQSVDELELQLGRTISDLHYYLRGIDELRETFDLVVRGTDLIEDAVAMLTRLEPKEYTSTHVAVLEDLQDFFYYHIWRYPCLQISARTATGPSAEQLATRQRERYDAFPERFESAYADSVERMRDSGVSPSPTAEVERSEDNVARTLTELSAQYLEKPE